MQNVNAVETGFATMPHAASENFSLAGLNGGPATMPPPPLDNFPTLTGPSGALAIGSDAAQENYSFAVSNQDPATATTLPTPDGFSLPMSNDGTGAAAQMAHDNYALATPDHDPSAMAHTTHADFPMSGLDGSNMNAWQTPLTPEEPSPEQSEQSRAYAMLTFPDCILYIKCTEFELGRDDAFYRSYKQKQKQASKGGKNRMHGKISRPPSEFEGRPEPSLLSTYSEHGGVVGWDDPEEAIEDKKPKHKRHLVVHSTSTNSIAPQSLHLPDLNDASNSSDYEAPVEFVPIHPPYEPDITGISRKHLRFQLIDDVWTLYVIGNGAFVNTDFYTKDPDRQRPIPIKWDDEIRVMSLVMKFHPADEEAQNGMDDGSDSLSEVPSGASDVAMDEDGRSDVGNDDTQQVRPKIKLKASQQLAEAANLADKGKKRKAPDDGFDEPEKDSAPRPVPPELADDSLLAGATELPAPRKGPGRPPKNGSFSKRDQTAMKRKEKEFIAKGLPVPPVAELLEIVRAEQKEHEARKKARGDSTSQDVVPSIEMPTAGRIEGAAAESAEGPNPSSSNPTTAPVTTVPPTMIKERSRSPVKPKEECDENDLKKPMDTYPVLIAIVLATQPNRTADLQQIYYLMEKKWPYYKWCTEGKGWQSSVRHNLRDNPHFKEAGKSGKGHYWTIDDNFPLESKKSKRAPSPGHNGQPQMQHRGGPGAMAHMQHNANQGAWARNAGHAPGAYNGQYMQGNMPPGQGYGPHAGQRGPNQMGHAQNGMHPPNGAHHHTQQGNANHRAQPAPPAQAAQQAEREQTPPPYNPMTNLVGEIIGYRQRWYQLKENQGIPNEDLDETFRHATEHFSNDFHNSQNYGLPDEFRTRQPWQALKEVFDKFAWQAQEYYIRQKLGRNLPSMPGKMPNPPKGFPEDGIVYPKLTAEQVAEYAKQGIGQEEYQAARRAGLAAQEKHEAERKAFRERREQRRAAESARAAAAAAAAAAARSNNNNNNFGGQPPGQPMPGQATPGQVAPGQGAPVQGAPVQGMPAQGTPGQATPGQVQQQQAPVPHAAGQPGPGTNPQVAKPPTPAAPVAQMNGGAIHQQPGQNTPQLPTTRTPTTMPPPPAPPQAVMSAGASPAPQQAQQAPAPAPPQPQMQAQTAPAQSPTPAQPQAPMQAPMQAQAQVQPSTQQVPSQPQPQPQAKDQAPPPMNSGPVGDVPTKLEDNKAMLATNNNTTSQTPITIE